MIIVTIIGISAAAFAPGFGRAMDDRRVSIAARELIRLGRRARSDTFGFLRAHMLWIRPSVGTVELLRSRTNSCTLTNWTDCAGSAVSCVESVNLRGDSGKVAFAEDLVSGGPTGTGNRAICYAPNGVVFFSNAANPGSLQAASNAFTDANVNIQGGLVYALYPSSQDPTAASARLHRVLFPLGSTPRALR